MDNRPQGRQKRVSGQGKGVYRRGSGLGSGPVGNSGGYSGRPTSNNSGMNHSNGSFQGMNHSGNNYRQENYSATPTRSGGRGGSLIKVLIIGALLLGGGGAGLGGLMGGGGSASSGYSSNVTQQPSSGYQEYYNNSTSQQYQQYQQYQQGQQYQQSQQSVDISSLLGGFSGGSNVSYGWNEPANTAELDTEVYSGARDKYTDIIGNGKDTVTIMVYMCGTDLESRSGMASSDLREMAAATISDNINLLVYTGGCRSWKLNISSDKNEIYKVESGGIKRVVSDAGSVSMTKPETLASFIKWCAKNYPANRNELILWDHGGGSLSGYGYDEKYQSSGSMTLSGIDEALDAGGVKFDFIGFDACLMATLENALMLTEHGDYLIASEETEPGVGWYYTNWLNSLSRNTSLPTLTVGKEIVDDFVETCARQCNGQKTTLSVVDLAELEATVPKSLKKFATATCEQVSEDYQTVSKARSSAREFASSSRIDQVDIVNLANNLGTKESKALAETLMSAVKYNRTSTNMTNAYGLSIYFPYQRASKVDTAVAQYKAIGMDSEYTKCIQQFASMEVGGQAISGGAASPLSALMGDTSAYSSSSMGADMISQMLGSLISGNLYGVSGLDSGNSGFLGRSLDVEKTTEQLVDNRFDKSQLVWSYDNGAPVLSMTEHQWSLVEDLELNVFVDDGKGYIDLGLDNVFEFTDNGALSGEYDGTWLAINEQPVPYYHIDTTYDGDNYTITGRVPVMLNGERADLILVFDSENPYGYVAGARMDYRDGETDTIAKSMTELQEGDVIDYICDYYGYDGSYKDSYLMGEQLVIGADLGADLYISNVYIDASRALATYRFTDIYCQEYWTPVMPYFG